MSTDVNGEQHAMGKDPVCGMEVTRDSAAASTELNGVTYYFCAERCRDAFVADPQRYLGGRAQAEPGKGRLSGLFRRR